MQQSWLMRFWWVSLLLLGFSFPSYAFESCQQAVDYFKTQDPTSKLCAQGAYNEGWFCNIGNDYYGSEYSCEYPVVQVHYLQCAGNKFVDQSTGVCVCPVGTSWNTVSNWCTANDCPYPQILVNGQCVDPPPDPQDCVDKGNECASDCGGTFEGIAYFYCETSTASDPSTQLFHTPTYKCECGTISGCPSGQQQTTSTVDGSTSCLPSSTPQGCPTGSYYGDFNGQTGCIKPNEHNDPDETPNNCPSGMSAVYYGSTLYCVPPKDTTTCPTGTTSFITDTGFKICKGIDASGSSTGDSPDTNGSIKGTPTSGSGTGSGTGDGSGSETGTDNAAIAAKLDQIKVNTDTIKASTAQTATNTESLLTSTQAIEDALTGTASNVVQGSFASSTVQLQADVEALKTQYASTISTVRVQMTGFLASVNTPTGTGGLPCYDSITIPVLNIPFALCFTQFEAALSIIGTYIYGIAFLFAGLIILGSSRGQS